MLTLLLSVIMVASQNPIVATAVEDAQAQYQQTLESEAEERRTREAEAQEASEAIDGDDTQTDAIPTRQSEPAGKTKQTNSDDPSSVQGGQASDTEGETEPAKVTIRFDDNHEGNPSVRKSARVSGKMDDLEVTLDDSEWNLPKNGYSLGEDYAFEGWSTTNDGKDVQDDQQTPESDETFRALSLDDEEEMTGLSFQWEHEVERPDGTKETESDEESLEYAINDGTITLYAQWERIVPEDEQTPVSPTDEKADASDTADTANGLDPPADDMDSEETESLKTTSKKEATGASAKDASDKDAAEDAKEDTKDASNKDATKEDTKKPQEDTTSRSEEQVSQRDHTTKHENTSPDQGEDKQRGLPMVIGTTQEQGYSLRLLVKLDDDRLLRPGDAVLGETDGLHLIGYDTMTDLLHAQGQYRKVASYVEMDTTLDMATGEDESVTTPSYALTSVNEMTADENPIAALSETGEQATTQDAKKSKKSPLVALLDTGAPTGDTGLVASASMLSDDGIDRNGHATRMIEAIRQQNPKARIMSIKVLDDQGHGTTSSVYAGIIHATDNGAKIINLSLAGPDTTGNQTIREAVQYALGHGVAVIAAAGNGGYDANDVTPANIDGVFTVGATDGNAIRQDSNHGSVIDAYVRADSTSQAAAIVSGWLSHHGIADGWQEAVKEELGCSNENTFTVDDEKTTNIETDTTQKTESDGFEAQEELSAAGTAYAILDANGLLTFFRSENAYSYSPGANQTVTDLNNNTYTGEVFTNIESQDTSGHGWTISHSADVKTVTIADGQAIRPYRCDWWFQQCTALTSANLTNLDVSASVDLNGMFHNCSSLTTLLGISNWNTSNVTDMGAMFFGCSSLTTLLGISNWNTSNVTDMNNMFFGCSSLTTLPDISSWDTSNVTNMSSMFWGCSSLATLPDISNWDTSNVTNMSSMFWGCSSLATLPDISRWNTSNVTDMSFLFNDCSSLTTLPDISSWNTSNVKDMRDMFSDCSSLATLQDIGNWGTSSVTNMGSLFSGCSSLTTLPDISRWNTSNVTDMISMFSDCSSLTTLPDISSWDTSNVTNMSFLFNDCSSLTTLPNIGNWDTRNVTNMTFLFSHCSSLTTLPDISSWNTSSVTDMSVMFQSCSSLATLPDIGDWDTSSVTDMSSLFSGCSSLISPPNMRDWDMSQVVEISSMFSGCYELKTPPVTTTWNLQSVTTMKWMFDYCRALTASPDMSHWNVSRVNCDCTKMFDGCNALRTITLGIDNAVYNADVSWPSDQTATYYRWYNEACLRTKTSTELLQMGPDISSDASLQGTWTLVEYTPRENPTVCAVLSSDGTLTMFHSADDVTAGNGQTVSDLLGNRYIGTAYVGIEDNYMSTANVPWNADRLRISRVVISDLTDIFPVTCLGWFKGCTNLTECDLTSLDTSNVTNMEEMFSGCTQLSTLDVSRFDTSTVVNMASMFENCSNLTTLDVDAFDTSHITDMSSMFENCSNLTTLDVDAFDTSHITDMSSMFAGCTSLTSIDVSNWDASNVTDFTNMFLGCNNVSSLEVGDWGVQDATSTAGMFSGCSALHRLNFKTWNTSNVSASTDMLLGCNSVRNITLGSYNALYNVTIPEPPASYNSRWAYFDDWENTKATSSVLAAKGPNLTTNEQGMWIWDQNPMSGTAYALVTSTNELILLRSTASYTKNQTSTPVTITDICGNTYTGYLYIKVENSSATSTTNSALPWGSKRGSIVHARVAENQKIKPISCAYWFYNATKLQSCDLTGLDTSSSTSFKCMFQKCSLLTSLDLSSFDTSAGTTFESMFDGCSALSKLNIASFDTYAATSMANFFPTVTSSVSSALAYVTLGSDFDFKGQAILPGTAWERADGSVTGISSDTLRDNYEANREEWAGEWVSLETYGILTSSYELVLSQSRIHYGYNNAATSKSIVDIAGNTWTGTFYKGIDGTMANSVSEVPWYSKRKTIKSFKVAPGSTIAPLSCAYWFYETALETVDFTGLETSNTVSMDYMFAKITSRVSLDLSQLDCSSVTTMNGMFSESYGIREVTLGTPWRFVNGGDLPGQFWERDGEGLSFTTPAELVAGYQSDANAWSGTWKMSSTAYAIISSSNQLTLFRSPEPNLTTGTGKTVTDIAGHSWTGRLLNNVETSSSSVWADYVTKLVSASIAEGSVIHPKSCCGWFLNATKITSVDFSELDTSDVTDMSSMFGNCSNAAFTTPDVSNWDTSNVINMSEMFWACSGDSFTAPNVSDWDTSSVTNMRAMFSSCTGDSFTAPDVSKWNTSNVTDMDSMFTNCPGAGFTAPDMSNWNTSNVTDMSYLFSNCSGSRFTAPDMSKWDTSNVTDMRAMFQYCSGAGFTAPDVSGWNTSNVTNMGYMFYECSGAGFTAIDVSGWNTHAVLDMQCIFANCNNLKEIKLGENFSFVQYITNQALLPDPSTDLPYTGKWINSSYDDANEITATELRDNYDGASPSHTYTSGTYVWNEFTCIDLKKVDSVTQDALQGAEFEVRDMSGNVLKTGITSKSDGMLSLPRYEDGGYVLVETKSALRHGLAEKTWLFSISNGVGTLRENGRRFLLTQPTSASETPVPTSALTNASKLDARQINEQSAGMDGIDMTTRSEWVDITNGKVRTTITANLDALPADNVPAKKERVLYATTTCTAHGMKKAVIKRNVDILLEHYKHVDVVVTTSSQLSGLRTFYDVQSSDFLDAITFKGGIHWAVNLFQGMYDYLVTQGYNPDRIYISHDRLVLGEGQNWDRDMEGLWDILKQYQREGRYFEVRGGKRFDKNTSSLGWKTIAGFIDPSSWNGYDGALDASVINDVETTVDQDFEQLGFESTSAWQNKIFYTQLTNTVSDYLQIDDVTVTGNATVGISGNTVTANITDMEEGGTVTIVIESTYTGPNRGDWFNTNASFTELVDSRRVATIASLTNVKVQSPKLAPIEYGYEGDLAPKDGDVWLMTNEPLVSHPLTLYKTDGKRALSGAMFTLTGKFDDGTPLTRQVRSDAQGLVSFGNIPQGTYTLSETEAPGGYLATLSDVRVRVTKESVSLAGYHTNANGQYEVANSIDVSEFRLSLVDKDGGNPLQGGEFSIAGKRDDGTRMDLTVTTDEDGNIKFDVLPGVYYVEEKVAPDGYVIDPDQHVLEVVSPSEIRWDGTLLSSPFVTLENEVSTSTLTVVIEWDDNAATDRTTPYVDISGDNGFFMRTDEETVWEKEDNTWTLVIPVADRVQFDVWEDLCSGYESSNPDGKELSVMSGDTATITNTLVTKMPNRHMLTIRKLDSRTSLGIGGAKFKLHGALGYARLDEESSVSGWVASAASATTIESSGNGYVDVYDMPAGDFTLEEVAAPAGYELNPGTFMVNISDTGIVTGACVTDGVAVITDTPYKYTVKYDSNGGTGTMEDMSLWYGEKVTLTKSTMTREDYDFGGWNTHADGTGDSYSDEQSVKNLTTVNNGVVRLYAQWRQESLEVSYDYNLDGATGTVSSQTFDDMDEPVQLTSEVPTHEMWNFVSWNTEDDGTGTSFPAGGVVENPTQYAGHLQLYAIWEPKQLRIEVPYRIPYVVKLDGTVTGPADESLCIENSGETYVALEGIEATASDGYAIASEGKATLSANEYSLGMVLSGGQRVDFSALDGTERRYAKLAPNAKSKLSGLTGRSGDPFRFDSETAVGALEWTFKAVPEHE